LWCSGWNSFVDSVHCIWLARYSIEATVAISRPDGGKTKWKSPFAVT
jgi:hypothetical protein